MAKYIHVQPVVACALFWRCPATFQVVPRSVYLLVYQTGLTNCVLISCRNLADMDVFSKSDPSKNSFIHSYIINNRRERFLTSVYFN